MEVKNESTDTDCRQDEESEHGARIASAFLEIVDVFTESIDRDRFLTVLLRAAELSGVTDGAIVITDGDSRPCVAVASCPAVLELQDSSDALCRSSLSASLASGVPVTVELRPADVPFEPYVARAISMGFQHEYVFPLTHRGRVSGALVLLDTSSVCLEPWRNETTTSIAGVAGALMEQAHASSVSAKLVAQLQTALDSRVVIEQAKGMLAARHGHDMDTAFRILRSRARSERRSLTEVAREVVDGHR